MSPALPFLAGVVLVAFTVQAALGFGATLIGLALGAQVLPISRLLPVLVPVNVVVTAVILVLDREHVDRRLLLRRIFPAILPGLLCGYLLADRLADPALERLYGGLVVVLAGLGLLRLLRRDSPDQATAPRAGGAPWIVAAGVVHGVFATGGPLLVLAVERLGLTPRAFRGTLASVWLVLSVLLTCAYAASGRITLHTATTSALLLPVLALAVALGHALHTRAPARGLRVGVLALLVLAGLGLLR